MVVFDEKKQQKKLEEFKTKEEEDLAQILAERYKLPYISLFAISINTDAIRLIPENVAREASSVAFGLVGKKVYVAVENPHREKVMMALRELEQRGYTPFLHIASERSIAEGLNRYKEISYAAETKAGVLEIETKQIEKYSQEFKSFEAVKNIVTAVLSDEKQYKTSFLLEVFIAGALGTDASDIHIEPQERDIVLRYRLDGVLHDVISFGFNAHKLLLSRIKILSGLKLNVKDEPQDGRFSIKIQEMEMEIRTSVIPSQYGESIVMRILNPKTITISFEKLGIEPILKGILEHEIDRPNGMILSTGPTGSGKTTTLYAFLQKIKSEEIKIITIEDPVEYHIPGITQTQVDEKKNYTFFEGLRSALRQDPDVILVGEIRDEDTAKTAIHAALTGHLVLSTLHTNNAPGTIPRLIDLGVNPKVMSSAINIAIAQRLVRKLCDTCKQQVEPTKEEQELITSIVKTIKRDRVFDVSHIWKPGAGCLKCNGIGYKGRIGVFEGIVVNDEIGKIASANPSETELRKAAVDQGILSMPQDGIIKVLDGITTLDELTRVVDIEGTYLGGNNK